MLSTEFIVIISFIILISVFLYFRTKQKTDVLPSFVVIIPLITNLFLIMSVFITYQSFKSSYQSSINTQTITILSRKTELIHIIKDNISLCPSFIETLRYPFEKSLDTISPPEKESEMAIRYISSYIFQSVVMYLTMASSTSESDSAWLGFFGRLFNSKKLVEEYEKSKHTISIKARLLIETLISINLNNTFNSPSDVIQFFDAYVKTKEFNSILEKIDETNVSQKLKSIKEIKK
jgi:hypothetical protein